MARLTRSSLRRWPVWLAIAALIVIVLWPASKPASANVTLLYFDAHWQADVDTVVMTWETAAEIDLAGFQLERSTSPDSGFAPINGGLVYPPAANPLTGATYGPYGDDDPPPTGTTCWYRLVGITLNNGDQPLEKVALLIGEESTITPTPTSTPVSHWVYLPIVIHR